MQPFELHGEALRHDQYHLREQRRPIRLEQPVERPAQPIIAQALEVVRRDAKEAAGKAVDGLLRPVDRLALDDDRAHQHPERLGVRQAAAPVGGGHVLLEEGREVHAFDEVINEGKRTQPLGAESECGGARRTCLHY